MRYFSLLEVTSEDLNVILEIGMEMAGDNKKPYVFLDEIQNVSGWEKFVRRLADMKYRVNITGSNSKMLSHEIASTDIEYNGFHVNVVPMWKWLLKK